MSPSSRRRAVKETVEEGLCSQRRACRYIRLWRSSGRYEAKREAGGWKEKLKEEIKRLSHRHPRLGYKKIAAMLRAEGWLKAGRKLVARLRREMGLRVKRWEPRRRRQGESTGRHPTRAEHLGHVWSVDFVADRTDNGGKLRILSVIEEWSRECLSLKVGRSLKGEDVKEELGLLVEQYGVPGHLRSDNGSEFISNVLKEWLAEQGIKTLYIDPGSPWQNGHVESFNGSLRDECLNRELILSVAEARVLSADYRRHYNHERPHGGIGYLTPAAMRAASQALASGRPTGSLHQGLDSPLAPVLPFKPSNCNIQCGPEKEP